MKLFLEADASGDLCSIATWGSIAGVVLRTMWREGDDVVGESMDEMLGIQPGDLLIPIRSDESDPTESRARELSEKTGGRAIVGLESTAAGLEVAFRLRDERIWTAVTPLASLGGALLALNAGADVLVMSWLEMEQAGGDAPQILRDVIGLCRDRGGRPKVLVTDLKDDLQVALCARAGAWAVGISPVRVGSWIVGENTGVTESRRVE